MSARSPFFFSPLSTPFSFLSRVASRLMGVKKPQFRCRSGENGQILRSHLFKNPGRCCKQTLPDGEKWPNFGWRAAFPASLGHFSPFHGNIYPAFWKRYRWFEVSERCVASTFLSFRNYLQSRQYKIECQESFFSSPLSPLPSLFSPVWFLGSWESKNLSFGVVPVKMGKSSGATFSKIQVDIYIYI